MAVDINFINLDDNNTVMGSEIDLGIGNSVLIDLQFDITEPEDHVGLIYRNDAKIGEFGKTQTRGKYLEWYAGTGVPIYVKNQDTIKAELTKIPELTVNWANSSNTSMTNNPGHGNIDGMGFITDKKLYLINTATADAVTTFTLTANQSLDNNFIKVIPPWHNGVFSGRSFFRCITHNGYVYVTGGEGGTESLKTHYAKIQPDGTVTAFAETASAVTDVTTACNLLVHGNRMYRFGGNPDLTIDNIKTAVINPDGSLGPWVDSPYQYPRRSYGEAVGIIGKYLIVVEGAYIPNTTGTNSKEIYITELGPAGITKPFVTSPTKMTNSGYLRTSINNVSSFDVLGGMGTTNVYMRTVERVWVDNQGNVSTEVISGGLTEARIRPTFFKSERYGIITGGITTSGWRTSYTQYLLTM